MVICSCNRLTDKDVKSAVADGATRPREIYASKGCKAQCGNCVPGVVCMLREARMQMMQAHLANSEQQAAALSA
ncbi:(2Fe-2S)-binding protein [Acetobacter indonesiensis]|jgi:bacterioferritin-associated ferredoxin|uniref:Bacterioferritin-associated ferredoxin n=1 Tax=Acetobacter indonesiensis TaxID=104101 RepID=A0A252AV52_9PROT|nr:(2Fe-2S)-binding protein [Acetobacter indonesiensis]MCG0994663.1 (2Fe-2S)-binding protein [Acetobacter indonesiensis]MCI1438817.1 (2Fe-2S)-binding protein [Acetobacter indonesiensis]MCI1546972.1 (2Fe-2S)-binding protein [Acetobacter indonesiensis]MCI1766356.1 (2Fe-2S)-binding protein [Acetobacter indonesiensis]MCP1229908.1 (2Fe-2S)-binding protein [Acetobacter indonesiensis]